MTSPNQADAKIHLECLPRTPLSRKGYTSLNLPPEDISQPYELGNGEKPANFLGVSQGHKVRWTSYATGIGLLVGAAAVTLVEDFCLANLNGKRALFQPPITSAIRASAHIVELLLAASVTESLHHAVRPT